MIEPMQEGEILEKKQIASMHQTHMECRYFTDLNHYKSSMKTDIIIPQTFYHISSS